MIYYHHIFCLERIACALEIAKSTYPNLALRTSRSTTAWSKSLLGDLHYGKTTHRYRFLQGKKSSARQVLSLQALCDVLYQYVQKHAPPTEVPSKYCSIHPTQKILIRNLKSQVNQSQNTLHLELIGPEKKISKMFFFNTFHQGPLSKELLHLIWEIWRHLIGGKSSEVYGHVAKLLNWTYQWMQHMSFTKLVHQTQGLLPKAKYLRWQNQVFCLICVQTNQVANKSEAYTLLLGALEQMWSYRIYGPHQSFIAFHHSFIKCKKNLGTSKAIQVVLVKQQLLNVLKANQVITYKNNQPKAQTIKRLIYQNDTYIIANFHRLFKQLKLHFNAIENKKQFDLMAYYLSKSLQKTLAAKFRVSTRIIRQRYGINTLKIKRSATSKQLA